MQPHPLFLSKIEAKFGQNQNIASPRTFDLLWLWLFGSDQMFNFFLSELSL